MKSSSISIRKSLVLVTGVMGLALAAPATAQVQTQTSTTSGTPAHDVTVESGEVVAVEGNDLFVKMADGSLRDFPNIPESARVTVDGNQLGIHDLKPGMKLQRTTVKTTTPQVVTTVETVTGKVWQVTPPLSVILTLENGENQKFKIPDGQKFTVNGQETDAFGLKKGMVVTATKIVETPVTSISHRTHVTGTMPEIPADQPVLVAKEEPTPAPAAEATTPSVAAATTPSEGKELPKTASDSPLVALIGLLSISAALGLRFCLRRRE